MPNFQERCSWPGAYTISISLASLTESLLFLKSITTHFQTHIQFFYAKLNMRYCINLSPSYFDEDAKSVVIYFCTVSIVQIKTV